MTIEQIIQLTQAGFTAEQITALAPLISVNTAPQEQPKQQEQPKPQEQPKQQEQPKPQEQQKPQEQPSMSDIMAQIANLTRAVTANAIINSNQPGNTGNSAEDALASIVIPTK